MDLTDILLKIIFWIIVIDGFFKIVTIFAYQYKANTTSLQLKKEKISFLFQFSEDIVFLFRLFSSVTGIQQHLKNV